MVGAALAILDMHSHCCKVSHSCHSVCVLNGHCTGHFAKPPWRVCGKVVVVQIAQCFYCLFQKRAKCKGTVCVWGGSQWSVTHEWIVHQTDISCDSADSQAQSRALAIVDYRLPKYWARLHYSQKWKYSFNHTQKWKYRLFILQNTKEYMRDNT